MEEKRIEAVRKRLDKAAGKVKKWIRSKSDIHSAEFRRDVDAYLEKNPDEIDKSDWKNIFYFMDMSDEAILPVLFQAERFLDNSADIDIEGAKRKAEEYTDLLYGCHCIAPSTYFEMVNDYYKDYKLTDTFGSRKWAEKLEEKYSQGMEYPQYWEIKKFSDKWIETIGVGDLADEKRLAMTERWVELAEQRNKEVGDEDPLRNVVSFQSELYKERQAGLITKKEFDVIDKVFSKAYIYEYDRSPAGQEKLKEMEQDAKGLSILIWMGIQVAVPLLFCLFCGLATEGFFLGGIAVWGLCTPVVLPLQMIGGGFLACALADAIALKGREPSDEYKAGEAAALGGLIVGGIHAGAGCARELSKPGWTKDSKKV